MLHGFEIYPETNVIPWITWGYNSRYDVLERLPTQIGFLFLKKPSDVGISTFQLIEMQALRCLLIYCLLAGVTIGVVKLLMRELAGRGKITK
jgi:hypothetical protein